MIACSLSLHASIVLHYLTALIFGLESDSCIPAILLRLPSPPHNGQARDEESCSCGTSPQEGHEGDEGKEGININASAEDQRSVSILGHCIRHVLVLWGFVHRYQVTWWQGLKIQRNKDDMYMALCVALPHNTWYMFLVFSDRCMCCLAYRTISTRSIVPNQLVDSKGIVLSD